MGQKTDTHQSPPPRVPSVEDQIAELDRRIAEAKNEPSLLERRQKAAARISGLKETIAWHSAQHCGACACADQIPISVKESTARLNALRFDYDRLNKLGADGQTLGGAMAVLIDYDEAISALEFFIESADDRAATHKASAKNHAASMKELKAEADACQAEIQAADVELNRIRNQIED